MRSNLLRNERKSVISGAWAWTRVARMAGALADLKLFGSGKVREVYEDGNELIMVASDRISVYDVILPTPIPDKGVVLNKMSLFWFELTSDIVPNHFISEDVPPEAKGRGMRVRKLEMFPVECVVRGYITGSGWKEYQQTGSVCGIELPEGLQESDKLPEPIFTPATKAELGEHDENIDFDRAAEIVGDRALMEELRRVSIEIYQRGADHAAERGIILADTKFELGSHPGAEVVLGDEVLTPDSSRFWPADTWEPGKGVPSFDKQYVRDYASSLGWDKTDPGPELPDDVVGKTRAKYVEAYERITERKLGG
ncbi:phosphoribosylaminoimidazolesuccinocarboxamide synthase [soil metagenome]